jgi:hypothetical protein
LAARGERAEADAAAKALNLAIPFSLNTRADELIE